MSVAVAHNDSARGKAALHAAAEEALLRKVPLHVLHLVGGVDHPHDDPAVRDVVTTQLRGYADLDWELTTASEGTDTAGTLLDLADELDADLLVIGSRRRRPLGKLILGSTVQRILLESMIPVLVVKAP